MKRFIAIVTTCVAWLGLAPAAEAQYCQDASQCAAGLVCVQGSCVQQATVQVQGAQGQGSVQVTAGAQPPPAGYAQPQPPPPGGQVYVQPQPAPQGQVYAQPQPQPAPGQVYVQPQAQPRYEERPIMGLLVSGIVVLAVGWVGEILVGAFGGLTMGLADIGSGGEYDGSDFFYAGLVPVAGPWIQAAVVNGDSGWMPWLIVDGILQAGGLTMLILGAVLTTRTEVYAEIDDGVSLAVLPGFGPDGASINAALSF